MLIIVYKLQSSHTFAKNKIGASLKKQEKYIFVVVKNIDIIICSFRKLFLILTVLE